MRFDPDLAIEHVRALPEERPAGSPEEQQTAHAIAERLEKLGLEVQRIDVVASRFGAVALRLAWLAVGLLMIAQTFIARQGGSFRARVVLESIAVAVALATAIRGVAFSRRWPPRVRSQAIVAGRPGHATLPTRLLFLAQLDTPPRLWPARTRELLVSLVVALVVVLGDLNTFGFLHMPRSTRLGLLAALLVAILVRMSEGLEKQTAAVLPDTRPSLAALLELARIVPPRVLEKVDVHFAAVGANTLGGAGARALADWIRHRWDAKPTVAFWIHVPPTCRRLFINGRADAAAVAVAAATGLWIPHRFVPPSYVPPELLGRALERVGVSAAAIVGETLSLRPSAPKPKAGGPAPTAQVTVDSVVQLALETALRWARGTEEEPQAESLDKSSQNPG
jgi:hypothetical protein